MASDLPSSSDELYRVCRGECGDGECQLAVANRGICPMRSADDFEAIRERMEELRQEQVSVLTCPLTLVDCVQACAVDDRSSIFCKKSADGGRTT